MTAFATGCFNATATITAQTWATQADGSVARTAGATQTNIPCRVNAMSASESVRIGREFGQTTFEAFFPRYTEGGTAVTLALDSVVTVNSVNYRVVGPPVDQGGQGLLYAVTLEVDS